MKLRFPLPKEQAVLKRKAGSLRARLLEDTRRKTKQAERMLGNAAPLSSSAKKKSKEAELMSKDNAKVRFRTTALLTAAFSPLVPKTPHLPTAVSPGFTLRSSCG